MIYIGNGIYSDSTPNEYLEHYGVKGMKWGQHLFSKDPTYFGEEDSRSKRVKKFNDWLSKHVPQNAEGASMKWGRRKDDAAKTGMPKTNKKKKRSAKQWAENKHRAHVANAEANKRQVNINASVSVNNKTKKLPRTSLGVLMKYDSLNENEYNQAMKNIRRRNEVYDAVINDAYRVHRAVNFAPTVLNDVTKTIKNVDYLSDRLRRHYNSKNNKQTILGVEPKYVNVEDQKAQHSDTLREGNYLEHYGRKGMKWGEHIFGEDESRKRSRLGLGIGLGLAATGAAAAIAAHKIKKSKQAKMQKVQKKQEQEQIKMPDDFKPFAEEFKKKTNFDIDWYPDRNLSKEEITNLKKHLTNFNATKAKEIKLLNDNDLKSWRGMIDDKTIAKAKDKYEPYAVGIVGGDKMNENYPCYLSISYWNPVIETEAPDFRWFVETDLRTGKKDYWSGD